MRPGGDVGNFLCATGPAFVRWVLRRVLHANVDFRRADRIGMTASMLVIAVLADANLV